MFQEKVKAGQVNIASAASSFTGEKLRNARGSLVLFLLAIVVVVVLGIFPQLRPHYQVFAEGQTEMGQVETGQAIMIVMLAAAGLIMLLFKAKPDETVKNSIMRGGIVAVISILGVSWMGSSFFEGNRPEIVGGHLRDHPPGSLGARPGAVCALHSADQPGGHGGDADACRRRDGACLRRCSSACIPP